jgi:hypothetical protein
MGLESPLAGLDHLSSGLEPQSNLISKVRRLRKKRESYVAVMLGFYPRYRLGFVMIGSNFMPLVG